MRSRLVLLAVVALVILRAQRVEAQVRVATVPGIHGALLKLEKDSITIALPLTPEEKEKNKEPELRRFAIDADMKVSLPKIMAERLDNRGRTIRTVRYERGKQSDLKVGQDVAVRELDGVAREILVVIPLIVEREAK